MTTPMVTLNINDLWYGPHVLLGPTLHLWVQGCPRRCPGCFNDDALDASLQKRQLTPEAIGAIYAACGGGVMISGGEPLAQASGLVALCAIIKRLNPAVTILLYTGFTIEWLLENGDPQQHALLQAVDILIDGPFLQDRRAEHPLLGSDNQRILQLSTRTASDKLPALNRAHVVVELGPGNRLRLVGTGRAGLDMQMLLHRLSQNLLVEVADE